MNSEAISAPGRAIARSRSSSAISPARLGSPVSVSVTASNRLRRSARSSAISAARFWMISAATLTTTIANCSAPARNPPSPAVASAAQNGVTNKVIAGSASLGKAAQRVASPATMPIIDAVATVVSGFCSANTLAEQPRLNSSSMAKARQTTIRETGSGSEPPWRSWRMVGTSRTPSTTTSIANQAVAQRAPVIVIAVALIANMPRLDSSSGIGRSITVAIRSLRSAAASSAGSAVNQSNSGRRIPSIRARARPRRLSVCCRIVVPESSAAIARYGYQIPPACGHGRDRGWQAARVADKGRA